MDADCSKSLTELENHDWGPPTYYSALVINVHRLRDKPLNEFTIDDLRLMIGQKVSLNHLMPLAIEQLLSDPLAEGDYYPGDLLCTVLSVSPAHWAENNVQRNEVEMIAAQALQRLEFDDEISDLERKALENAMCVFQLSSGKNQ